MRILLGLVGEQEHYSEDESETESKHIPATPEIVLDSSEDVESLQIRSLVSSSSSSVPVNNGDVLAILSGPSHESESAIVGLAQVISTKLGKEIVENIVEAEEESIFINFKVLTPYIQIDTAERIENRNEYDWNYIRRWRRCWSRP